MSHCTGKTWKKNPYQGKHGEFGNFAKTQGILFAQVVDSLNLTVKYIVIFDVKVSNSILEAGYIGQVSFV